MEQRYHGIQKEERHDTSILSGRNSGGDKTRNRPQRKTKPMCSLYSSSLGQVRVTPLTFTTLHGSHNHFATNRPRADRRTPRFLILLLKIGSIAVNGVGDIFLFLFTR